MRKDKKLQVDVQNIMLVIYMHTSHDKALKGLKIALGQHNELPTVNKCPMVI